MCANTSTICSFQPFNEHTKSTLIEIRSVLLNPQWELLTEVNCIDLKSKFQFYSPLSMKKMIQVSKEGKLPSSVRNLLVTVIEFCINSYNSFLERAKTDYFRRTGGEVKGEFFPNFPLIQQPAVYDADGKKSVDTNEKCRKLFPDHQKLTAGLFLMTCCCKYKRIYGFKKNYQRRIPKNLVWFNNESVRRQL